MSGGRRRGRPARGETQRVANEPSNKEEITTQEGNRKNKGTKEVEGDEKLPVLGTSESSNSKNGKGKEKALQTEMPEYGDKVHGNEMMNDGDFTPLAKLMKTPRSATKWSVEVEDDEQLNARNGRQQENKTEVTKSWAEIVQGEVCIPYTPPAEIGGKLMGELQLDEVEASKEYWNSVLVCKVIGSYPPYMVMNGFLNRIWKHKGLEKVWQMDRGVFMAKFTTKEEMEATNSRGGLHLDGKPILTVPWSENLNYDEIEIPAIPVWIQLPKLELKYWSPGLIGKIISSVGKPTKVDGATLKKERLQYARVMVEMKLKEELDEFAV